MTPLDAFRLSRRACTLISNTAAHITLVGVGSTGTTEIVSITVMILMKGLFLIILQVTSYYHDDQRYVFTEESLR